MNELPSQQNEEYKKFSSILPAVVMSIALFFFIHSWNDDSRHELHMIRDQNWKVVSFEIIPPYSYQISKIKSEYSFEFYKNTDLLC
ncbi:hypothetical protein [Acinetobacter piscicola]|uniref:hypothetical protein n=1 Tax=Acinetobacter piscicola TaxID=2006115 RepID=UPI00102194A0|nr:hypothetical protein [Acinetobacter piscicola]RYL25632.1 hypothetical protein EWP19_11990 [Acinetobacter piscicola]